MPYPDPQKIQSPLARARNIGAGHTGTHHWWMVKVSAIALIPLTLWFFFALMHMVTGAYDYDTVKAWVQKPYNSLLLCLLLGMNFYHAAISGQEVIVDYVHKHRYQVPALLLYKFFCYGLGVLSIYAVLYITFKA